MTGSWRLSVLKIVVSCTLLWLILRRFSFQELKAQVVQTDPRALLLPLLIILASNLLGAVQWGWIVRASGLLVSRSRILVLYFIGLFFNNFLFGNLGGDVYKIYGIGRHEGSLGPAAGATIVDRLVGVSALCALALTASVVAVLQTQIPLELTALVVFFSVGTMLLAGVMLHGGLGQRLETWLQKLPWKNLSQRLSRLHANLREYRERSRLLNGAFLLSLVIQSARVLAHFFVGLAMGWSMAASDLGKFFLVIPILGLIIALPISIGGWGVREWSGVALFAPLGRNGEEAVTLLALTASMTFLVSLLGGFVFLFKAWRD